MIDQKVLYAGANDQVCIWLTIEPESDVEPEEFQCYSKENLMRWHNGDWSYVYVTVSVEIDHIVVATSSLGGVEYGTLDDTTTADVRDITDPEGISYPLTEQALSEARAWFAALGADPVCLQTAREWLRNLNVDREGQ
jgi:hypothetical protein